MPQDHWPPGETLAICRSLALARAVFAAAIAEKPAERFTIRSRTRFCSASLNEQTRRHTLALELARSTGSLALYSRC